MVSIKNEIAQRFKRVVDTTKRDYGRVFIVAGSRGMTGAASLCALGALRAGAGLVTVATARSAQPIVASSIKEVMTISLPETRAGSIASSAYRDVLRSLEKETVLVIGPGLTCHPDTVKFVRRTILDCPCPMVIDADALNALVGDREILAKRKSFVIMTPHSFEFSRLCGCSPEVVLTKKNDLVREKTQEWNATIVLKGHRTIVANHLKSYSNDTGNPGMSTGGTGDVLAGMIGAFLAQGLPGFEAAQYAVFIHGLAGDIAARRKTMVSLVASDVIDALSDAFRLCNVR